MTTLPIKLIEPLKNGQIIVYHRSNQTDMHGFDDAIRGEVKRQGLKHVMVIVIDANDRFEVIDEAEMNKFGWYRGPKPRNISRKTGKKPKRE